MTSGTHNQQRTQDESSCKAFLKLANWIVFEQNYYSMNNVMQRCFDAATNSKRAEVEECWQGCKSSDRRVCMWNVSNNNCAEISDLLQFPIFDKN